MLTKSSCQAHFLTSWQAKACKNLSRRGYGNMSGMLNYHRRNRSKTAKVYRILDGGRLLAWALLMPDGEVHIYTRVSQRRKGYGTMLMKMVKRDRKLIEVHAWCSPEFFTAVSDGRVNTVAWDKTPMRISGRRRLANV